MTRPVARPHRSHVAARARRFGFVVYATGLLLAPLAALFAQDSRPRGSDRGSRGNDSRTTAESRSNAPAASSNDASPLDEPIQLAEKAREKFRTIQDYSCMFIKQEIVAGKQEPMEFIQLKVRNRPFSVYLKWQKPHDGREAIYVEGQNSGKLMVHSTGVEKVVGGTVSLDPRGKTAMESSRHEITEAGIGNLIEQLCDRWAAERKLGQTTVTMKEDAKVDGRPCILVKTEHPRERKHYTYYRTHVYFDKETSLPIHFEGYDWPMINSSSGDPSTPNGKKIEDYTYRDLKFNVQLTAKDFDVDNPKYNFGRL